MADPQNQDWFTANAPPPSARQLTPAAQDWFASNAPKPAAAKPSIWERMGIVPSSDTVPPPLKEGEQAGPSFEGSPGELLSHASGQFAKNAAGFYVKQGPGQMLEGASDISKGDIAKGGHKVISGGMVTALPIMPEAIAANPLMAARAVAGGYVGSKVAGAGAEAAGANPEQKTFAEDLGNLAGGFSAASGLPRALFESAAKSAMNKVATSVSGSLDPDIVGLISPRLAHLMRMAGKVAEVTKATTEGTASGPVPAGEAPTPQTAKPSTPDYKVPNATYLRPEMRSLSQQPPEVPVKPDLLKGIREHEFLMKVQDELNRQGGDEQAQKEIDDWIEQHNQQAPGAKPQSAADVMKAKFQAARAQAESKANAVPSDESPQFAYRVRDVGETGIMPKGHAQATTDLPQAQSYVEGRGSAQGSPQEVVKVDLSKMKPSEYTLKTGPGGKTWVQFKSAVPESFIEKVGEQPRVPTSDADMENLLMKSIQSVKARKAAVAKAGD